MAGKAKSERANVSVEFLRDGERVSVPLLIAPDVAASWDYTVRNRRRWISDDAACERLLARMEGTLRQAAKAAGTDGWEHLVGGLESASVAEVAGRAPAKGEAPSWTIMPWEYALSALAWSRRGRGDPSLAVLRRIDGLDRPTPEREPIDTVLFVSAAPGAIGDPYPADAFDAERELVHSGLDPNKRFVALHNPTLAQLAGEVASLRPDAIHITAVDGAQGRELLGESDVGRADAIYLADESERPAPASSDAIGQAIARARSNLRLVSFNVYNSAGRLAPDAIAGRAAAAIGFQDEVDDRLAEHFFGELYLLWRHRGVLLEEAFEAARASLSASQVRALRGSGVVLTGAEPWTLEASRARRDAIGAIAGHFRSGSVWRHPLHAVIETRQNALASASDSAIKEAVALALPGLEDGRATAAQRTTQRGSLTLRATPMERLNYSMLHNRRSFFGVLSIHRPVGAANEKVSVEVTLNAGSGESTPWKRSIVLRDAVYDLAQDVHLPLVSELWRRLREQVGTTIGVRVTRANGDVEEETCNVTLLPLDEWKDTNADRVWLPSFVLSRDRAIVEIVRCGQRHLMTLADDRRAGFDGYQSVDRAAVDVKARWLGVDMQARALWSALLHDHPLDYINPPPSFTELSQRLRSPGEIVAGGRGTCIDLALLYAACLEFVDIHPVLFVVRGHAFAGFWRSEEAYDDFVAAIDDGDGPVASRCAFPQRHAWSLGASHHPEILRWVARGALVPIETTMLTDAGGFAKAMTEGSAKLHDQRNYPFCAMLDVAIARREGVTPLPVGGE